MMKKAMVLFAVMAAVALGCSNPSGGGEGSPPPDVLLVMSGDTVLFTIGLEDIDLGDPEHPSLTVYWNEGMTKITGPLSVSGSLDISLTELAVTVAESEGGANILYALDKIRLEGGVKDLLAEALGVTVTVDAGAITAAPYAVGFPVTVLINEENRDVAITEEGGNLEAGMEWLTAYRGWSVSLSVPDDGAYDLAALGLTDTALDLALTPPPGAEGYALEISSADLAAVAAAFTALLENEERTVSATASGLTEQASYTAQYTDVAVAPGMSAAITVSGGTATANIASYSKPASVGPITMTLNELQAALGGVSAAGFVINRGTSAETELSLAHVHYLRQLWEAALPGTAVTIDTGSGGSELTPSYNNDWVIYGYVGNTYHEDIIRDLYAEYDLSGVAEITLMNGISIKKDTRDGKKILEYARPITIDGAPYINDAIITFSGFGIRQAEGGSVSPAGGKTWGDVVIGGLNGDSWTYRAPNWSNYLEDLARAGLSPIQKWNGSALAANNDAVSDKPYPKHNMYVSYDAGEDKNIMANGMYDFVLAYYNPDSSGVVQGADLRACLISISGSRPIFDGAGVPAIAVPDRVVAGINNGSALSWTGSRKTGGDISGGYRGNITTAMARYLQDGLYISEFKNANIYGDYNAASGVQFGNSGTFTNVGLVGNYSGAVLDDTFYNDTYKGVLDIKGNAPRVITNRTRGGYLKFIGNASDNRMYENFVIVDLTKATNVGNVGLNNNTSIDKAELIIFGAKSQASSISAGGYNTPTYRAFQQDGGTVRKYAPSSGLGDSKYQSPNNPIGNGRPRLDESDWEAAGSAASYVSPVMTVTTNEVWAATDFTNGTIALSPAPSGVYLAAKAPVWALWILPASRKRDGEQAG
jgi:hypothetical protein